MRFIFIVAGLFLVGAGYNFISSDGDVTEGIAGLVIAASLIGLWWLTREQDRLNREFVAWLSDNAAAIASGGSRYKETLITGKTEITQYQVALSFLIVSIKVPSRFLIAGDTSKTAIAWSYTIASVVFGWWGIPWGPVYTIQSVFRNLKGGHKQKVWDILAIIQKSESQAESGG